MVAGERLFQGVINHSNVLVDKAAGSEYFLEAKLGDISKMNVWAYVRHRSRVLC